VAKDKKKQKGPTKPKSTKGEAQMAEKKGSNGGPEQMNKEDHLVLQLAYTTLQNANLQMQLVQQQTQTAQKNLQELMSGFNTKYNMDTDKDRFEIETGIITRG
jgi:hypothetical protein